MASKSKKGSKAAMEEHADAMDVEEKMDVVKERSTDTLPWVEKYRPASFDDLIAHDDIISTLNKLLDSRKLPHLLFYGPPGTGKTSTIKCLARKLIGGANYQSQVLELNASDERRIQTVRDTIKDFASTKLLNSEGGVKLIILDEADAMTNDAQAALRRVIEKFTRTTRFCLICNHVNKVVPAIQSRCTKFRFPPLREAQVRERLNHVVTAEHVSITEDGLKAVIRLGAGDMRRCLNILQATHMSAVEVTEEAVYNCTGSPLPRDIQLRVESMLNDDFATAFDGLMKLKVDKGLALQDIVREVHLKVMALKLTDPAVIIQLLKQLSDIEYRLAFGTDEKLQTASLVSSFQLAKEAIAS
eukprot:TRINITY_DN6962_c0_g1_i1.p1 TRINITY_DN6962_c0_g1~~TRINITY_DN6962_c0_g1_i1.p1  ORF type:complete len:369 (+),score=137.16 TRINITY_DN6962_c0_g1_i1:34-1107(+)